MPAINMEGPLTVPANPSGGKPVIMDPFSGPAGSALDNDQEGNHSTGALSTGIGFGPGHVIPAPADPNVANAGFTTGYVPGVTLPSGDDASDAILLAIGGGYSDPAIDGEAVTDPIAAAPIAAFGNGASRDLDEGVGRGMLMAEADAVTANGEEIADTGHENRSGITMGEGESTFGVEADGEADGG